MVFGVGVEVGAIVFDLLAELFFLEIPDVFRLAAVAVDFEAARDVEAWLEATAL